ncbi:MAG TPA: hypothetical protein VM450_08755 [Thermomicrobiales bacterium]|nr:hypothetical protein [Thermomicrobiales bacterium]
MGKGLLLPLVLATSLATGAFAQGAPTRPDPHGAPGGSPIAPASTPAASGDPGCDLVGDYARDLSRAFLRADDFFDFLGDDTIDVGDLTPEEGETIVASGEALIADLEELEAPGAYAGANAGIIQLMQVNVDLATFYSLDTSAVPNIAAWDAAIVQIHDGEIALAAACPDEVDEIGGYVFSDPRETEEDLDQ